MILGVALETSIMYIVYMFNGAGMMPYFTSESKLVPCRSFQEILLKKHFRPLRLEINYLANWNNLRKIYCQRSI